MSRAIQALAFPQLRAAFQSSSPVGYVAGRPTATGTHVAARALHPHSSGITAAFSTFSGGGLSGSPESLARNEPATPKQLGYTMPCESDPHAGTWMSFPHDRFLWRQAAAPAQRQMADLARTISQYEQVWMLTDTEAFEAARGYFRGVSGVELVRMPTNDVWARDWGPTCVVRDVDPGPGMGPTRREVAAVHFDYNCYGSPLKQAAGKPVLMPDWSKDREAGRAAARRAGLRAFECPLHLEGGAMQSNGRGTVLVTEECLLHFSRNPQLGREGTERLLREYLGAERVVWLWKGIVGDEEGTNGHVDNVAAFAGPETVLLAWSDDPRDPMHEVSIRNLAALEEAQQSSPPGATPLCIIKVPCPEPPLVVEPHEVESLAALAAAQGYGTQQAHGVRLAASYINHYVVNGAVVVPQFGGRQSRSDEEALEAIASAHLGRRVVGVMTRELLLGGGNVHCLTQHLPEGLPEPID